MHQRRRRRRRRRRFFMDVFRNRSIHSLRIRDINIVLFNEANTIQRDGKASQKKSNK